jgi:hypothetical protein
MPDPTENDPAPKVPDPKATVQPTDPPVIAPVGEEPSNGDGKVLQVKHSDFKRIKEEARERGRREATAELESLALVAGYDSLEEFVKAQKKPPAPQAPVQSIQPVEVPAMPKKPDPKPAAKPTAAASENARLADERTKMRKQWRREEKLRRDVQRQLDAKEAEMALREEMYRLGVTDVDYGLRLLTRELAGKSEEEIAAFDRTKFFEGVRKERPYLFGERVQPATTGTNGAKPDGSDPKVPPAGAPAVEAAKTNQFDARTAKPEDVQARLKSLGLNPHM